MLKGPKNLHFILHKISQLSPKMLRVRREKVRGKIFMTAFSLLYILLPHYCLWQNSTFLLLKIKSPNCYFRNFKKSMDILRPVSLLEPTSVHPHCWHKNKRLQDNFSKAKIIHVAPHNTS